jgi:Flp pilus assembly protein TadD
MESAQLASSKFDRLTAMLKADPANKHIRVDSINFALELRRYEQAAELAEQGLALIPNDETLLLLKSNALIGSRNFTAARTVLELLHAFDPQNVIIGQNLSLCCYCLDDFSAARTHLESIYATGVRTVDVVRLLVSSCHHLGLMERAIQVADENKALAREDSALSGVFALAYLDVSRVKDAAKFAAMSLRDNPNGTDAIIVDAALQTMSGDVERARQGYERVLEFNPAVGRAWLGLGAISMLTQDVSKARMEFNKALEFMPGHVGTWHMVGWVHLISGELDDAEKVFNRAMELDRNFAETHGALGSIAAMRGNIAAAKDYVEIALRLDPTCLSARLAESVIVGRGGNATRSQQVISEAIGGLIAADPDAFNKLLEVALRKYR